MNTVVRCRVAEILQMLMIQAGRVAGGCGSIPGYSGSVQQVNGPMMADPGYRGHGGQFGYQPQLGGFPQPGGGATDVRDGPHYPMAAANQFPPAGGSSGAAQQISDSRQVLPPVFQHPEAHPVPFQTSTTHCNVGNSSAPSLSSKSPPASMQSELPADSANQSKSKTKQEDQNLPPTSSGQLQTSTARQLLPNATESSSTSQAGHPFPSSNGSAAVPRKDSLSEAEQHLGEVGAVGSGNAATTENSSWAAAHLSSAAYPHQTSNMDAVRGRSSDVVAMEGMPSRYGVGPEGGMDGRYAPNGRDGYVIRMGHPVPVDGAFRHGYQQRPMESYDRSASFAGQPGTMPSHFPPHPPPPPHPGYFNHQHHHGYQFHPHVHSSHAPPPYHVGPGEAGPPPPVPDRTGDVLGGTGRQQHPGLMTPPSSVTSSTSHPSNDCEPEKALPNGEAEPARRTDNLTKISENNFPESKLSTMQSI